MKIDTEGKAEAGSLEVELKCLCLAGPATSIILSHRV